MSGPAYTDILYLDYDGVLHHEDVYLNAVTGMPYLHPLTAAGRALFEWASRLEELLEPHPSIGIVLSTSWVLRPGPQVAVARLPTSLRARVVGATYHPDIHGATHSAKELFQVMPRGVQVVSDVIRRRPQRWLAVDDNTLGWTPASRQHVVLTDGRLGLSCRETREELKARLAEMPETSADCT